MDVERFSNSDNWLGSYYALSIEVSSSANSQKLTDALEHLWHNECIQGPWLDREDFSTVSEGHEYSSNDEALP